MCACMYVYIPEEDIRAHGTTVIDSCEPPCSMYMLGIELRTLGGAVVIFTIEPSLQHNEILQ